MRTSRTVVGAVALVVVGLLVCTQVISQEKSAPAPAGQPQMDQMMAKWAEVNVKGPEHQHFEKMVGTWECLTRMWVAPGVPPQESVGRAEFRLILDGRFIQQEYTCQSPEMPFQGLGITGYDSFKKKYVSLWMDSLSNAVSLSLGTPDESGKVFTYYGTVDDPTTGERDVFVRSVIRELSDEKVVMEMYETRSGAAERKVMELTYTRKK